jgi:hypothetical protein
MRRRRSCRSRRSWPWHFQQRPSRTRSICWMRRCTGRGAAVRLVVINASARMKSRKRRDLRWRFNASKTNVGGI